MIPRRCCPTKTPGKGSRLLEGGSELASWIIPTATLALLPKCPMCVAAYVALATGFGLTLSAATSLRTLLIVLCITTLLLLIGKRLRHFLAWRR